MLWQIIFITLILDITQALLFPCYWNLPTFQCLSHKINFTTLAVKYNLKQNSGDKFYGEEITILYDPGEFPAIIQNGSQIIYRNGGVPQEANLTLHLDKFQQNIDFYIPNKDFRGVAVIDFESWRPIFRQNFDALKPYQDLSIKLKREKFPNATDAEINRKAKRSFEKYGKLFMEETLILAKNLRSHGKWGYYGYPLCFNEKAMPCSDQTALENNQLSWLWQLVSNLYPSVYIKESEVSPQDRGIFVKNKVEEARRIAKKNIGLTILTYFWFKYEDTTNFMTVEDLNKTLSVIGGISGIIFWGSTEDINTAQKCQDLYDYVDSRLGPILKLYFHD